MESGGVHGGLLTIFLCGDVMTGRGVDQILPHPGDPRLRERYVHDARSYVRLAEAVSGPIPRPAGYEWPWGDALPVLDGLAPDARVINLETSITRRDTFAPGKGIHYRMSPANAGCLAAARPDVCTLANNHVLDFGRGGLADTLGALARAGLAAAGAGVDGISAAQPAAVGVAGRRRVLVLSCGTRSSGIPPDWAAGPGKPGLNVLPDLSARTAGQLIGRLQRARQPGDVVVVSIHWGPNWGYGVPADHIRFAHRLLDGGADVIHGHSSHHPRPVEVYRGKLVLYGCGDCIDDYEGISGYPEYRDDLRLMYFAAVEPGTGQLAGLRMVPMQARKMRLQRAAGADTRWLAGVLRRISRRFGTRVDLGPDGLLTIGPAA
jgi:poly-gamma-glutamate capsule biosynthesis protein CapA/YwtB (metallophosphatase superfamily)